MLTMPRPKKVERRSRTYRLPVPLMEALERLADKNRRPVTTELEIAIEEHLRANGEVPEPPAPAAPPKKKA